MSTTPDTFKARFEEFEAISDARVQIFLDDAALDMNEPYWGPKYDLGQAYLAAHFLIVANKQAAGSAGSVNPATSRSVDGSSVSYASPIGANSTADSGDVFLNSTSYGQLYLNLRNHLGVAACVI